MDRNDDAVMGLTNWKMGAVRSVFGGRALITIPPSNFAIGRIIVEFLNFSPSLMLLFCCSYSQSRDLAKSSPK
jgi:hypothetical protein